MWVRIAISEPFFSCISFPGLREANRVKFLFRAVLGLEFSANCSHLLGHITDKQVV